MEYVSVMCSSKLMLIDVEALDYPPFFAYFEKIMSIPAALVDPRIVDLNNLNYSAWSVVAYQRSTVIATELVLGVVLLKLVLTYNIDKIILIPVQIYP
jgi:alpha-1,3-glucosyltransferase